MMQTLAALLLLALTSTAAPPQIETFESEVNHFKVSFPSSWQLLNPGSTVFEIINFARDARVSGVVIPRGGASIQVIEAPEGIRSIDAWVDHDKRTASLLSQADVTLPRKASESVLRLRRAVYRFDASGGGQAFLLYTIYYLEVGGRLFSVDLTTWEADGGRRDLEVVARNIALSLRSTTR